LSEHLAGHAKTAALAAVLAFSNLTLGALATAAGRPTGTSGFANVATFLNNVATYLIYLAVPAGVIGGIVGGIMLIAGSPDGPKWLARTGIGVGVVLLSKGLMA
jgi:hypothetical protein